jgi:hypothetical protein
MRERAREKEREESEEQAAKDSRRTISKPATSAKVSATVAGGEKKKFSDPTLANPPMPLSQRCPGWHATHLLTD